MNIGILTISILVLLSPGFFFRRGYYSGVFSKQYFKQNIVDSVLWTIIPSILLHILGYFFFIQWDYVLDMKVFAILLSTTSSTEELKWSFDSIFSFFYPIISYFTLISILSFSIGIIWKKIVRDYYLDSRFKILRFRNYWHYIFTGEILNFPNIPGDPVDATSAYLDLICTIGEENYIYRGFLLDYQLSKEHELDSLALFGVKRRKLNNDSKSLSVVKTSMKEDPYYTIEGQFVVFKYNEIRHINVTYYNLQEEEEEGVSKELFIKSPLLKKGWLLFHIGWIIFFVLTLRYLYLVNVQTLLFTNKYLDSVLISLFGSFIVLSFCFNQIENAYGKNKIKNIIPAILMAIIGSLIVIFIVGDKWMDLQYYQSIVASTIVLTMGISAGYAKGLLVSIGSTIIGVLFSIILLQMTKSGIDFSSIQILFILFLGLITSIFIRFTITINNFNEYWKRRILNIRD